MKEIMLSISPLICTDILNEDMHEIVCKTKPRITPPFKVYIYCTIKGRPLVYAEEVPTYTPEEFLQTWGYSHERADRIFGMYNGKVVGEFICDKIEFCHIDPKANDDDELPNSTMPIWYLKQYLGEGRDSYYNWHISDLKIHGEPFDSFKTLEEFGLDKPPKGWCYTKCKPKEDY